MADADAEQRRRVVHVFGAMDRGGAELRTVEAVEWHGRTEFDTVYVTLAGTEGVLDERIRTFGDRVLPIRLNGLFPLGFVRFLRDNRTDVVHSHVATFSGATLALARLARVRKRVAHFRSDGDQRQDTLIRRGWRATMKVLLSWAATDIVGVSPGALDHGWRSSWRTDLRCRVIANGIDMGSLPSITDRWVMRAELGLVSDARVICHVGRPAPGKNRRRAIDLACHADISGTVVTLMVGSMLDGEAEGWLSQARARGGEQAVRILGSRTDVLRILNASDVTLVTSIQEGLPGVVLESLAVGTPVVSSDLPGVRWIAEHVDGVQIRSLQEPDAMWVHDLKSCLTGASSEDERARVRSKFENSVFRLDRAAVELAALWRGSGEGPCG